MCFTVCDLKKTLFELSSDIYGVLAQHITIESENISIVQGLTGKDVNKPWQRMITATVHAATEKPATKKP